MKNQTIMHHNPLKLMIHRMLMVCSTLGLATTAAAAETRPTSKPNIIVILADDLGYGDTSIYGNGWVRTPQLDRMASEGLLLTDFHSNSSVCSPTRAAFLTGRYQQRVGIVDVIAPHLDTPGLDPSELTLPRLMKQTGYRTALFGKWHLGTDVRNNPINHGFDEFKGFLDGAADYHAHAKDWYDGLERKDQNLNSARPCATGNGR